MKNEKYERIRPGLRWVFAAIAHIIVLFILFKLGEVYFNGAPEMPRGIQLAEWVRQTQTFLIVGAGLSFGLFVVWNIVFHFNMSDAHVKVRWLFWVALLLNIVAEVIWICVYLNRAHVSEWSVAVFSVAMLFYLGPLSNFLPFLFSLRICSPSVIEESRRWSKI
jgi:hypothetical protein